jgi:hypothetical protein
MRTDVLVPVLVAVATGLAFLAYRHRSYFLRLRANVDLILIAAIVLVLLWNGAVLQMWSDMVPLVASEKINAASTALHSRQIPALKTFGLIFGTWAYLRLLGTIPAHDNTRRENPPD